MYVNFSFINCCSSWHTALTYQYLVVVSVVVSCRVDSLELAERLLERMLSVDIAVAAFAVASVALV